MVASRSFPHDSTAFLFILYYIDMIGIITILFIADTKFLFFAVAVITLQ